MIGNVLLVLLMSWGPLIGLATLAYHQRRRGACAVCRAGGPDGPPTASGRSAFSGRGRPARRRR
ncbi:MAG: hypothetical protein WCA46_25130, partial [Actinocatenispora sp.]